MELRRTETGFALYKEKEVIGHCTLHPAAQGAALAALAIDPAWRRKGYGSYLLKEVLRSFGGYDREAATVFTAPLPVDCADHAVFSTADSSIPALQAALQAVRPGGIVSAILYSGAVIGTDEKQAVLAWLRALPLKSFTVLVCDFANWAETAPLPCFILKK